jgi:hypothetical protein
MVDLESPFACRSRKLDGAATSPEEAYQNGHKSNFPREAKFQWAGPRENISTPVEAELFS